MCRLACFLLCSVAFSGLAKPLNEKRFRKNKYEKEIPPQKKGWGICTSVEAKATYFYLKPQGYILGYTADKMISSDGGWAPGIGTSVGVDIGRFGWRVDLAWNYSRANPYQSYSGSGIHSLLNAATYTSVEQWLDMKINRLIFLWSCEVNLLNRFVIRPKAGTEALWLHQKRRLRYNGGTTAESYGYNNFTGIGSSGGFNIHYRLGRGFALVGDSLFSLLWGNFRTKGDYTYNDTSVQPAVHLSSGLEWAHQFKQNSFQIGLLYEVHHYFSQGQARYGSPQIQPINTDFNASGPSFFARVCF